MIWLSGLLAVACLAVAVVHVARLLVRRVDVIGEATHAAMGAGMAAMFSPIGDPVPDPVWTVVFLACGAWFAAVAVRSATVSGDAGHHVVGSGAMLFMQLSGHSHAPGSGGSEHAEHLVHGGGAAGGLGLGSVAAIVLAGYFAWHVLRCADRVRACTAGPQLADDVRSGASVAVAVRAPGVVVVAPHTAAVAHLVMGVAMAVMLLGMV